VTTIIVAGASIAATPVRQNKQTGLSRQEASSISSKYMPPISYNAIVKIHENKNKQQKQAQPHDTRNAHHARNTCSTNSASESTGRVKDTIPRQQDECKQRQQEQQYHIILVGFLK
jgi:hypothetical protein